MNDTIITVEGRYDSHHPAERGTVHLSVGFEGPERARVVSFTADAHSALADGARRLRSDGKATWWSADRMRAWSDRPWNKDGKQLPLVHHASIGLEVKFADLEALAVWAEQVAGREGVTVTGIHWALTDITRARLTFDAQHRAVLDAVHRATAYATSLGLTAVHPVALADPGMLGDQSRPDSPHSGLAMDRAMGSAPGNDGLDLKPEDITVAARVHARFVAS